MSVDKNCFSCRLVWIMTLPSLELSSVHVYKKTETTNEIWAKTNKSLLIPKN